MTRKKAARYRDCRCTTIIYLVDNNLEPIIWA